MCTSIMAGLKATKNNIIIISRNEDFTRNNWNKYLVYRSQPEYAEVEGGNPVVNNKRWTLGNGMEVDLPKNQFSYSAMPDAAAYSEATHTVRDRYYFEERGINGNNVGLSATNSLAINDKANKADPLVDIGVAESVIPTLILPQAQDALHAVKLLGGYVENLGASEVNGVLIGDIHESWYVEIGSGHHWIAVRIPEDSYLVVANGMRVHDVDLDSDDVIHSAGLYEFVRDNRLLTQPNGQRFNFAEAFGLPGVPANVDRIWLAQRLLTPSKVQKTRQHQYPLFLKPDNAIEISDVMAVLRANYQGTELEGKADRPIGVVRTAESHIITLDPSMPSSLQGLIWQVVSTPLGAPYMPLYNTMTDIPVNYSLGGNQYSPISAYWAFRGLFSLGDFYKEDMRKIIQDLWTDYERQIISEESPMKQMLKTMHQINPCGANKLAAKYSTGISYQTVGLAHKERDRLMTQLTDDNTFDVH